MEPRFFWRRVAALLIDLLIASALSTILALPFLGNTDKVRLAGGMFRQTNCSAVSGLPHETLAILPQNIAAAGVCQSWFYGFDAGLTLTVVYDRVATAHTSSQKSVSLPVDANGRVVWPWSPDAAANLLLLTVATAFALVRWGKTPGKHLMGLILSRPVTFGPALLRETLRLWPLHLSNLLALAAPLYGPYAPKLMTALSLTGILGIAAGFAVFSLLFYLLPLIRWRGQMPWDRLIRTTVARRRILPF